METLCFPLLPNPTTQVPLAEAEKHPYADN